MTMYRIAIVALGLVLADSALALEGSVPELSNSSSPTLESTSPTLESTSPTVESTSPTLQSISPTLQSAPAVSVTASQPDITKGIKRADFASEQPSRDVRHIADWVVDSGDNKGLPYLIIDKVNAKLFVFDAGGRIRGAAPVLLGLARGDHTVPGIGNKKLSEIRPNERTTPAGRFVAERGMSTRGVDVVWVDYDTGVSMHRVVNGSRQDRRLERLATPTAADNRISYGCINVPIKFYNEVVNPSFTASKGIIYLLPEVRAVREVFASYDVETRLQYAGQTPAGQTPTGQAPANPAVVKTSSTPH
ncbi:MAG TPA: hypothetical protein VM164_07420 [Burkholderiales bacterium]|nr:hypothetical protein [Burkholderiales bacterium]